MNANQLRMSVAVAGIAGAGDGAAAATNDRCPKWEINFFFLSEYNFQHSPLRTCVQMRVVAEENR